MAACFVVGEVMAEDVKSERPSGKRYWIPVVILLAVAGYFVAQYFGPYTRMVRYLRGEDRVERLAEWGRNVLEKPPEGVENEIEITELPEVMKGMPVQRVTFVKKQEGKPAHVRVSCGTQYYKYGVDIGGEDYKPGGKGTYVYEKLGDGLWGFAPATTDKNWGE